MPAYESYEAFRAAMERAAQGGEAELDRWWDILLADEQVPYVQGEQVAFLYRGEAFEVDWRGDFTGWRRSEAFVGERVAGSNLWLCEARFPQDARLDYKIFIDGEVWLLDRANPRIQYSGFGPNSALAMPGYTPAAEYEPRPDVAAGTLHETALIDSQHMEMAIAYQVYTPADCSDQTGLPVVYVTDGHEYSDPRLGAMTVTLDNMIADGRLPPLIAVFIDPRNPEELEENRRQMQYSMNEKFAAFITRELVPFIEGTYPAAADREARAIVGTSLGGLHSAYTGATCSDVFGLIGMQSPAFFISRTVYSLYEDSPRLPLRIHLSAGQPEWDVDISTMRRILEEKDYPLRVVQVQQGHSWGQWRDTLPDLLTFLFAK